MDGPTISGSHTHNSDCFSWATQVFPRDIFKIILIKMIFRQDQVDKVKVDHCNVNLLN